MLSVKLMSIQQHQIQNIYIYNICPNVLFASTNCKRTDINRFRLRFDVSGSECLFWVPVATSRCSTSAPSCLACPFLILHASLCLCVHTLCVFVCVLQLQQTCASYPWRRGAVENTLCAGTLTVSFRPAGPSSTAAVEATRTASSTRRSVRRSASGKPKVQNH